jgi:formylglycine-generating enzyme required for sulfatase activity
MISSRTSNMRPVAYTLCLALTAVSVVAAAEPPAAPAAYPAWKTAHPHLEADIKALKVKTAAMVAAAGAMKPAIDPAPVIWRVTGAVSEVWEGPALPQMVVIPAGEYTMGSPKAPMDPSMAGQAAAKRVRIAYPLGFSKYPVTVAQFAAFVAETGYDAGDSCQTTEAGVEKGANWKKPGFVQPDTNPVVCVNFQDGQAYAAWLSKKTGHTYRLPTDAEYEYANRAGTTTSFWWGDDLGKNNASCASCGSAFDAKLPHPVGTFAPNPFGLYDTTGEVWSRTLDCWKDGLTMPQFVDAPFTFTPADGSPAKTPVCDQRALRGGGYRSGAPNLRAFIRHGSGAERRFNDDGFHVVREL